MLDDWSAGPGPSSLAAAAATEAAAAPSTPPRGARPNRRPRQSPPPPNPPSPSGPAEPSPITASSSPSNEGTAAILRDSGRGRDGQPPAAQQQRADVGRAARPDPDGDARLRPQPQPHREEQEAQEPGAPRFFRLPDGRQIVPVRHDTAAGYGGGALSHALGAERQAVVRFAGSGGSLAAMRVLTLANVFLGGIQQALSFLVDVRETPPGFAPPGERPPPGGVSFAYRVLARARRVEAWEGTLAASLRSAPYLLDLSINVRQMWGAKGEVDEEAAYDLADTFYACLLQAQQRRDEEAQQREQREREEAELAGHAQQQQQQPGGVNGASGWQGGSRRARAPRAGALPDWLYGKAAGGGAAPASAAAAREGQRQGRGPGEEDTRPSLFVSADLAQGVTTLTALALLQRRLRAEGQPVAVEATMYRCSVAAPRLDGRDGWVFALRLAHPREYAPRPDLRSRPGGRMREPAAQ